MVVTGFNSLPVAQDQRVKFSLQVSCQDRGRGHWRQVRQKFGLFNRGSPRGSSPEEQKGKYISRDSLPDLVKHVKVNMEFSDDEAPDTSSGSLLHQFQSTLPVDVPIHPCIQEVIKWEWPDPDKFILPCFMAKLYPLQDMSQVLPDSIHIDSFVASLVGWTSLDKDVVVRDLVGKKVDGSLKKAYFGNHLMLRAGIDGTYVAQSLLSDLKSLGRALDKSSDCTGLLAFIDRQVEFLSDISFDVVHASLLAAGACVGLQESGSQRLED
ncbi:hypothetical protein NDU88_003856 [Pleurodeles waltl]|uniref:Uncharacterized protein n=1 Tax=Pleurodeles waltl TaxID=8319 RepID=A0AAV7QGM9_PLEWA|nr:hypothetical protein NDU88_003856 [Pleurodeles waltl]